MPVLSFDLPGYFGVVTDPGAAAQPRVRNIYVDPETGRFALTNTGNLRMTSDLESIAQGIRRALNTYLGEWFLDTSLGVDWRGRILVKNPNSALIADEIRTVVQGVVGVRSVTNINVSLNKSTRALTGSFTAVSDLGQLTATFVPPSSVGV